jgi:hypothetical protein
VQFCGRCFQIGAVKAFPEQPGRPFPGKRFAPAPVAGAAPAADGDVLISSPRSAPGSAGGGLVVARGSRRSPFIFRPPLFRLLNVTEPVPSRIH